MATTTNETGILVIETNQGPRGTPGQGVPVGGTTGQFLKKKTGTDYDTEWSTSAATVTSINDIGDVVVTTPTNGQVLKYDSGTGMWINGTDGGTTSIAWGSITGTLSSQVDLQSALDSKSGTGHTHFGVYEPANANIQAHVSSTSNPHSVTAAQVGAYTSGAVDTLLTGKSDTSHTHSGVYQPVDGDLTAIAALAGTAGILTKTAADTWSLDTNTYSTTSHNHTGVYEPANANIQSHIADGTVHFTQASISITESQISDLGTYEPAFTKNTAFNKDFGTLVGTVCQGNDARLSDARTPTAHTHVEADITDLDKYSQSQVNTLLSGKSDTSHTHSGVYQPVPTAGTVQTTDATATVVQTIAIPSGAQRVVTIRVKAYEAATDALLWKTMTLGVKNIAGTASFVGGVDSAVGYDASASTWTVVAGVSSGNVTVTVTGEAAKTIDWASSVETY